jgi:hypothetical protein
MEVLTVMVSHHIVSLLMEELSNKGVKIVLLLGSYIGNLNGAISCKEKYFV